jgi:excisionase family DNA binding protein
VVRTRHHRREPIQVDPEEAARRLEVSTATMYALCETGRLANVRISTHSIRIRDSELKAYVAACRVGK